MLSAPAWPAAQGTECGEDGYFAGAAGDGATLVWAWTVFGPGCGENGYDRDVVGGGVVQVKPPLPTGPNEPAHGPIGGIPAAAPAYSNTGEQKQARQLAVSQGRIAVLPSPPTVAGQYWWGFPAGTVRQIALSWPHLAVLVRRPLGSQAIERCGVNGGLEETTPVATTATDVSIGTGGIVYRVGRTIYTSRRSKPALLWRAKATPIGLSVEGRRVAWAVNLHGSGLIVASTLPR